MEDPDEYEKDGAKKGEGGDGVNGGGDGGGRERRGGGMFSLRSFIRFPNKFTPSLIKRKKKSKL